MYTTIPKALGMELRYWIILDNLCHDSVTFPEVANKKGYSFL